MKRLMATIRGFVCGMRFLSGESNVGGVCVVAMGSFCITILNIALVLLVKKKKKIVRL